MTTELHLRVTLLSPLGHFKFTINIKGCYNISADCLLIEANNVPPQRLNTEDRACVHSNLPTEANTRSAGRQLCVGSQSLYLSVTVHYQRLQASQFD